MSDYSVDYLRRLVEAIEVFEGAFEAWIATQHEFTMMDARGLWPTVRTRDDADATNVRSWNWMWPLLRARLPGRSR